MSTWRWTANRQTNNTNNEYKTNITNKLPPSRLPKHRDISPFLSSDHARLYLLASTMRRSGAPWMPESPRSLSSAGVRIPAASDRYARSMLEACDVRESTLPVSLAMPEFKCPALPAASYGTKNIPISCDDIGIWFTDRIVFGNTSASRADNMRKPNKHFWISVCWLWCCWQMVFLMRVSSSVYALLDLSFVWMRNILLILGIWLL